MSVLVGTPVNDDTLTGDSGADNAIFGDAQETLDQRGGDDLLTGGSDATNTLFGDARRFAGPPPVHGVGGDDRLNGGANSTNTLVGDAETSTDDRCGDDTIAGGANSSNTAAGDTLGGIAFGGGGNDTLLGGENGTNDLYGDAAGGMFAAGGGDDRITGGSHSTNLLSGDAASLSGNPINGSSVGGDDVLVGGAFATNKMFGDAVEGLGGEGGNDTLTGGNDSANLMFGDAGGDLVAILPRFHSPPVKAGGDDDLAGGDRSVNTLFGDAGGNLELAIGGFDRLAGGADSSNVLVGDGGRLVRVSLGGDDTLVGGAGGSNSLFGDALGDIEGSKAGNDTLIAGDDATNTLVGDGDTLRDDPETLEISIGGDDLLVGGTGVDDMWGDAKQVLGGSVGGRDVFRFLASSGDDTIHDFERGKDLIEVNASLLPPASVVTGARLAAFAALAQPDPGKLTIEERDANNDGAPDSIIHLDAENNVTVLGVTGLTSEDIVAAPGTSYVLFSRTSTGGGHRDDWVGSEANSQPSTTPGSAVPASAFNADAATGPDTVLGGAAAADYAADGIVQNGSLAMFNLTEASPGIFATGAPADLSARIAAAAAFFGSPKTDLDPAHSDIDLSAGRLHLAQTDKDWNGIKNLEISLDSDTSFRDIRLENFVDTRLKLGDVLPDPDQPQGARFAVQLLAAKRGEVDASHAPQAMDLVLAPWTNSPTSQNSFDVKGSAFNDTLVVEMGQVLDSAFGQDEFWYASIGGPDIGGIYRGLFTPVFASLGAGDDSYDSDLGLAFFRDGSPFLENPDVVRGGGGDDQIDTGRANDTIWGGSGDDLVNAGGENDRLFGDQGSGSSLDLASDAGAIDPGDDHLDGGGGADWIEGNGGDDLIDCGSQEFGRPGSGGPRFADSDPDIVNFNAGDGDDFVVNFGAGFFVPPGPFPPPPIELFHDVLRIQNIGTLTTEVINGGTLVQNGAGSVFLAGVTVPLAQSVDGQYLLLFDAA